MTSPVEPSPTTEPAAKLLTGAEAAAVTRRITRLSVGVAVVLIALKAFALGASGSVSVLASLADSSLDLIASLATFFAVRWAAAPADAEHRHGHGKGEAMPAWSSRVSSSPRPSSWAGRPCSASSIPARSAPAAGPWRS